MDIFDVAEIAIENGEPAIYLQTISPTGETELKRFANGKITTIADNKTLGDFILKDFVISDGEVYASLNEISQFFNTAIFANSKATKFKEYPSEARQIKLYGNDVLCVDKCFLARVSVMMKMQKILCRQQYGAMVK